MRAVVAVRDETLGPKRLIRQHGALEHTRCDEAMRRVVQRAQRQVLGRIRVRVGLGVGVGLG